MSIESMDTGIIVLIAINIPTLSVSTPVPCIVVQLTSGPVSLSVSIRYNQGVLAWYGVTAHPQGSTMVSTLTLLTTIPGVGLLGDTNDTNALDTPPGIGTSNSGHTYRCTTPGGIPVI